MLGEVSRGCWWGRGWASQWCGRRGPPRRPLDKGDGAREGAAHLWAVPARPAPACAPVLRSGCLAVGASVDEGWRQARARPPVLLAPRSPAAGRGPERRGPVASVRTSARSSAWRCLWPCRPSDRLARDECWGGGALRARRGCAPTCPSGSSGPFRARLPRRTPDHLGPQPWDGVGVLASLSPLGFQCAVGPRSSCSDVGATSSGVLPQLHVPPLRRTFSGALLSLWVSELGRPRPVSRALRTPQSTIV